MTKQLTLQPIASVAGKVHLPGSKSISNRALLLAAMAKGTTTLTNLLDSDDIRHMLKAFEQLGVTVRLSEDKTRCEVDGVAGVLQPVQEHSELFLGNAGTAMRPLCAALTLCQGTFELTGEPRMQERPIGPLVDALRQSGANIEYLKNTGYPPLKIIGTGLNGGKVEIDGSISSQFLTAFLMAAPLAAQTTEITIVGELVSKPYIDITLKMMERFGVSVENDAYQRFVIPAGQSYVSPGHFLVEGDASSASYFLAAGAMAGDVTVEGVGRLSMQGDTAFADVLEKMGAEIEWGDDYIRARHVQPLQGVDLDLNEIPDAAMTLATAALVAKGTTLIRNVYNWRVKETDRLAAMACELNKLGVDVEEGNDYLRIVPAQQLNYATIDTYNDHRIAMCFSLVALAGVAVTINDPGCTSKTFPDYFEKLAQIANSTND
ncbi:3-phosphoshikimate 1-carboxyvinyltransferase [Celerinatantimonas diazotrophica]|uniref:3-phosphoshikimate 1-carboxyvinyltransferase n=1 Tax=Celerinatantimonas diazotrophica TaxID=412034 RepID=A0A4R1JM29_9GAMM|nr:3-phosphoshikimate 1-carboxyvinyltransferase [Celerinatantimonas diazotrophica]TCK52138.1 3-phosphoshikimate 1-carboxyvinyltransferase [Celerinatantimonas diazotrophica]CAG9296157.1 3-phosphoshikimate 1-carboxyvinyltransferase [Celerinatantimonas diazotrophica]